MKTLVIAHRTGPRDAPENSLAGITAAAGLGADVVELDARRSRDGVAVLLHDPMLLRVQHLPLHVRWLRAPRNWPGWECPAWPKRSTPPGRPG